MVSFPAQESPAKFPSGCYYSVVNGDVRSQCGTQRDLSGSQILGPELWWKFGLDSTARLPEQWKLGQESAINGNVRLLRM